MKKQLVTFCGLFLLASPIQLASAAANTTEDHTSNVVSYEKKCTVSKAASLHVNYVWKLKNGKMVKVAKPIQHKVLKCKLVPKQTTTTKPVTETQTNQQSSQTPVTEPSNQQPTQTAPTTPTTNVPVSAVEVPGIHAFEQQVLTLTNAERAKQGLSALQADAKLMAAAREKSVDMQKNNYFSHTSPTFGSPFDRMKALGISYKAAGENIAKGQRTPEQVVQAWMDSPGHRANILNANFTHLGVGFVENGYYWTQQFIQK